MILNNKLAKRWQMTSTGRKTKGQACFWWLQNLIESQQGKNITARK